MNIAVIFAGGTGKRMNTRSKPKQFLEMHGKPVLIYTLENFQNHPQMITLFWFPLLHGLITQQIS